MATRESGQAGEAVTDVSLRLEIMDLLTLYAEVIDDDRLEEWPELFMTDGRYAIIPRENIAEAEGFPLMLCEGRGMMRDRVMSLRHANIYPPVLYRHFLSAVRITRSATDRIAVSASYLVLNTDTFGETHIFQTGRYEDIIAPTSDGWRFKSRTVIYDTARVQTLLAYPV